MVINEQARAIATLEATPLAVHDKVNILATLAGVKPACSATLSTSSWHDHEAPLTVPSDDIEQVRHALSLASLASTVWHYRQSRGSKKQYVVEFFVAKQQQVVDQLVSAVHAGDDRKLGHLFGFPKTAVEAYITGTVIPIRERARSTADVSEEHMLFLQHMISQANAEDEVRYLPNYAAHVYALSPTIYNEYVAKRRS
ncbi:MAG TPA: hypothetical protein VFM68_02320 [Candidatus Saccharimonadales bacterium]|nr:hypothetical protein [Candidatus Saccharimonadales bacterium]